MHLHRVTPDPYEPYSSPAGGKFLGMSSEDFKVNYLVFDGQPTIKAVSTRFERFGGGKYRQSDYEVYSEWKDVETIIEKFCEMGHPDALALRQAQKLAATVRQLGWQPPASPQSN